MTEQDAHFYSLVHQQALSAANAAAQKYNSTLPPEQKRGLDCGFAWVQITPGNSPFARWLAAQSKLVGVSHFGSKHWDKGWHIWASHLHGISTQSMGVHQAAAQAYADAAREKLKERNQAPALSVGTRYD